ncbi:MAG: universal stress protein [Acidobacteria bacterium]|nr:universal stress protein [Acidobacteriota bacterium]
MNERMKILIGYDGSACAKAALVYLQRAGLPRKAEVRVLSVAELWIPLPASYGGVDTTFPAEESRLQDEALQLAHEAQNVVKTLFPEWHVHAEAVTGSPVSSIVWRADEWQPDLLVVGSHGRTALGRFFFGSVSQGVLHHARGSVRIARANDKKPGEPLRFVVGVDGSACADEMVQKLAHRHWSTDDEAMVVAANWTLASQGVRNALNEQGVLTPMSQWIAEENERINAAVEKAVNRLKGANLRVTHLVKLGDPKQLLVNEAERWGADCIYVGSHGMGRLDRILLGSVSSAVAARAHCSVEVVR